MKFQNRSIHGSKVNRRTHRHTYRQTDRQTDKPKAICPSSFFKVGGINNKNFLLKIFIFYNSKKSLYIALSIFRNGNLSEVECRSVLEVLCRLCVKFAKLVRDKKATTCHYRGLLSTY